MATFSILILPPVSSLNVLVQAVNSAPGDCEISNLLRYRFQALNGSRGSLRGVGERRSVMRTLFIVGGIALALFCLPSMIQAQGEWFEYFDTYANDSDINGQGGWEVWPGGGTGYVRDDYSYSSPHSLEIAGLSDVVHQYYNYTSGKWLYRTWVYIPGDMSGQTYFIMLNTYTLPGTFAWSVQMSFRSLDGNIHCDCGDPTEVIGPAYETDTWIPIWVFIDLDEDWTQVYVDGFLLDDPDVPDNPTYGGGYPWTGGVFGGEANPANIAAVDLFANNATPVFYDNMQLRDGDNALFDLRVSTDPTFRFEYDIYPGNDWGIDSDVFLSANTPQGFYSFTGVGSLGWVPGIQALETGPLGIHFGVPLDFPQLPPPYHGNWTVYLGVDTIGNGAPNLSDLWNLETESFTYP
jgi:hypothetical protein